MPEVVAGGSGSLPLERGSGSGREVGAGLGHWVEGLVGDHVGMVFFFSFVKLSLDRSF